MANFFAVRTAIKQHIEAEIPGIKRVYFAEELDDAKETTQILPAVHVLYGGYRPAQAERARVDISLDQTWVIVLSARNSRDEEDAGELLDLLVQKLHGWQPPGALLKFELTNSPFAPSYRPRIAYYPLAFSTRVINRKGA